MATSHTTHTTITPPWPGVPYTLACPEGTPQASCDLLSRNTSAWLEADCFEPEHETAEVLNSLLLGCHAQPCTYVDIGCNIGAFAAQAAALGVANIVCCKPTPSYSKAVETTRELNRYDARNFAVRQVAVVPGAAHGSREFSGTYNPCGIVPAHRQSSEHHKCEHSRGHGCFWAPETPIRTVLHQAIRMASSRGGTSSAPPVTLLKIDIDANEGSLLSAGVRLIERKEVSSDILCLRAGTTRPTHACLYAPCFYMHPASYAPCLPW